MIWPPYSTTAARFTGEALLGMITWAVVPTILAASQRRREELVSRGGNARAHLPHIRIGGAVWLVMQVVKLDRGAEACLQHFHLNECCDRLPLVRQQL